MRRFSIWNGTRINPAYRDLADVRDACYALKPDGRWRVEWYVKGGEGGAWCAEWDPHPLAIDGFGKLLELVEQGRRLRPALRVVPYIVVRGRPDWNEEEWHQIAECAVASRIVVLNLEDGPMYWNGPTDPEGVTWWMDALWEHIHEAYGGDPAWRKVYLELAAIPRQWVIDSLGGDDDDPAVLSTLEAWLAKVRGVAWEMYGDMADDLRVDRAMPRVYRWLGDTPFARRLSYRIPLVQRSEIGTWAQTGYARAGLQVWHLDADI